MQRELYRIEYSIKESKKKIWYYMGRDYDEAELPSARSRLKNLREQGRGLFVYRLVKRVYLDEVLND